MTAAWLDAKLDRAERTIERIEQTVQKLEHNPVAGPLVGLLVDARISLGDLPVLAEELRAAWKANP
jgi:hypothetical protein